VLLLFEESMHAYQMLIPHQVIRKNVSGFNPNIVHSTLKALTFIGDFDSAMVKSVEDELIYKIMNRYEAENNQRQQPTPLYEVEHATTKGMVREFVCTLVDEVSTGVEIAAATENVLGSFKVRACLRDLPILAILMV
jgi:tRNA uridine 5-carbamoylmethylation protein Kti12